MTLTITLLHLVWQFERLNSGIPGKHKTPISRGVSLQRCQRWGRLPKSRNGVAFFGSRGGAGRQKWPFLGTAPPFFAYFGAPSLVSPAFGSPFMSKCLWGANIHWSDVMWTVWDEYDKNIDSPALSKENMSIVQLQISQFILLYVILTMNGWCLHGSLGEGMNEWLTTWMGGRCVLGGFEWMIGDWSPGHEGMGTGRDRASEDGCTVQ